jgi:hypothetical protein
MAQKPHADPGMTCPHRQKTVYDEAGRMQIVHPCMSEVCHTCPMWRQYPVVDDKGKQGTHWDCSLAFAGQVAVQQVGEVAQNTKAVQQLRNLTFDVAKIAIGSQLYDEPEALAAAMNAFKVLEAKEMARALAAPQ